MATYLVPGEPNALVPQHPTHKLQHEENNSPLDTSASSQQEGIITS